MNYAEATRYLESLSRFGSRLGLERMEALLELLGNPQQDLLCLHIAGTNGKGSTAAFLTSILQAAGVVVGTYTSPHLSSFRERIKLCGQEIPQEAVAELTSEIKPLAEKIEGLTKFEFTTALAFRYFQKLQAQLVVLEVGMGGRLDATNTVVPIAAGITHLALDHTRNLGTTLGAIAGEKAGIIKEGRPLVTVPQAKEAEAVLADRARELGAPMKQVVQWPGEGEIRYRPQRFSIEGSRADFWLGELFLPDVQLGLLGRHQLENAALALGLAQRAYEAGSIPLAQDAWEEALRKGLENARWPGRLEYFPGEPSLLLDGAHNADGMRKLAQFLEEFFPRIRPTVVLGILGDKDYRDMLAALAPVAGKLIVTQVDNPRNLPLAELTLEAKLHCSQVEAQADPHKALAMALAGDRLVVVAGSLYLVGELRPEILRFFPAQAGITPSCGV